MAADHDPQRQQGGRANGRALDAGLGQRMRDERMRHGLSLRELARRVGLSPSALSQIETGRSRPSVGTLYAIVSELRMSLDELFAPGGAADPKVAAPGGGTARDGAVTDPVQRAGDRKSIDLESGVRWERLTPTSEPDADFLYVVYEVGGASSQPGTFIRHTGREYGLVLTGRLRVVIGFEGDHVLGPGDSITFDSTLPHRLENIGDVPTTAVWFVVGRGGSDARMLDMDAGGRPASEEPQPR
jgi:transcriptional regulator with XRE-family HTH domain